VTTNITGTVTASRTYRAYGTTRSSSGTLPTDRTFTGQKQDGTGLLYYNARYYDPTLGTFLSPDTLVPDVGVLPDNKNRPAEDLFPGWAVR
jgi:RHS repeat-associated protein